MRIRFTQSPSRSSVILGEAGGALAAAQDVRGGDGSAGGAGSGSGVVL
jgi:hypothetical protein